VTTGATTARWIGAVLGAALLSAISVAAVAAHVELVASSPAVGANLSTAPNEVTITFDDELDPDFSSFTVTDGSSTEVGSGEVDLTVADRNVTTGPVTITAPGVYTVTYNVAGVDGHQLEGSFSFGYQATTTIPGPTSNEGSDTAMSEPHPRSVMFLLGALFLLASATIAVRRLGRS
jgi:methionine-rich copper-binding protein CopC